MRFTWSVVQIVRKHANRTASALDNVEMVAKADASAKMGTF